MVACFILPQFGIAELLLAVKLGHGVTLERGTLHSWIHRKSLFES